MISTSTSEMMNTWNFVCLNRGMKKSMKRRSSQLKTQLTKTQKESLKNFRLASYSLQKVRVFWISIFPIIEPNTCQSKVSPYPEATPGVKALEKIKQLLHVNFFNKGKVLLHSCWVTREKIVLEIKFSQRLLAAVNRIYFLSISYFLQDTCRTTGN